MNLYRNALPAVLLAFLTSASLNLFAANTTVGSCPGPGFHYGTIGLALAHTSSGGTVSVCPGTYAEQVLINQPVTLKGVAGSGTDAAVIVPPTGGIVANGTDIFGNPVAAQVFVSNPGGSVTISHLTVDGTGNNLAGCVATTLEGIYFQNASGTITDNVVKNQYQSDYADYGGCQNGLAINVESLTSAYTVSVSYNSVRAYQKNGITATGAATGPGAPGPAVTMLDNYIVGLGATAMNWQGVYLGHGTAAENGIQFGFGASGSISGNTVNDNIWGQDTSTDTGDAASGILIYASSGVTVLSNYVGSAQFGIVAVTDSTYGPADNTTITNNKVTGTQIFDGIDLCSSSNTVRSNNIYGSAESGVHMDDTCGSGNSNTVTGNTINEACAGVLLGSGTGNTSSPNTYLNVVNTTLGGDVCPVSVGSDAKAAGSKTRQLRPSPFKPGRK